MTSFTFLHETSCRRPPPEPYRTLLVRVFAPADNSVALVLMHLFVDTSAEVVSFVYKTERFGQLPGILPEPPSRSFGGGKKDDKDKGDIALSKLPLADLVVIAMEPGPQGLREAAPELAELVGERNPAKLAVFFRKPFVAAASLVLRKYRPDDASLEVEFRVEEVGRSGAPTVFEVEIKTTVTEKGVKTESPSSQ